MLLKKYQFKVIMPEIYDVLSIILYDHNGLAYTLQKIPAFEMGKLQEKPHEGQPLYFEVHDRTITFFPRPDKDYPKVMIDYLPPKKQI